MPSTAHSTLSENLIRRWVRHTAGPSRIPYENRAKVSPQCMEHGFCLSSGRITLLTLAHYNYGLLQTGIRISASRFNHDAANPVIEVVSVMYWSI